MDGARRRTPTGWLAAAWLLVAAELLLVLATAQDWLFDTDRGSQLAAGRLRVLAFSARLVPMTPLLVLALAAACSVAWRAARDDGVARHAGAATAMRAVAVVAFVRAVAAAAGVGLAVTERQMFASGTWGPAAELLGTMLGYGTLAIAGLVLADRWWDEDHPDSLADGDTDSDADAEVAPGPAGTDPGPWAPGPA